MAGWKGGTGGLAGSHCVGGGGCTPGGRTCCGGGPGGGPGAALPTPRSSPGYLE